MSPPVNGAIIIPVGGERKKINKKVLVVSDSGGV